MNRLAVTLALCLAGSASAADLRLQLGHAIRLQAADIVSLQDRHIVLTVGMDERAMLWDAGTGSILESWDWPDDFARPHRVVIAAGGEVAFSWSRDWRSPVRIDLKAGELRQLEGRGKQVVGVWPSRDRRLVAVARKREPVRVFRLPSLEPVGEVQDWPRSTRADVAAFSRDGRFLVVADSKDHVTWYDLKAGLKPVDRREFPTTRGVELLAEKPSGGVWALGRGDEFVIWDARARRELAQWEATGSAGAVRWTSDGRRVVLAIRGRLHLLDPHTGKTMSRIDPAHVRHVRGEGPLVFTYSSYERGGEVWDLDSGARVSTLPGRPLHVSGVGFLPDGRRLAVGTHDGRVQVWDLHGMVRERRELQVGKAPVTATAVTPDGKLLLAGDEKGHVVIAGRGDGAVVRRLRVSPGPVRQLELAADGERLVLQHWTRGATFSVTSGADLERPKALRKAPLTVAPDGRVAWYLRDQLRVPEGDRFKVLCRLERKHVKQLRFTADGRDLLALLLDGSIRRLDADSCEERSRIDPGSVPLERFALSHDGRLVAAVDEQAVVRLWVLGEASPRVSLFVDAAGEWIAWRPDGAFDASPGGGRYVAFKVADAVHPMEAFSEVFRVPGLVGRALGDDIEALAAKRFDVVFQPPPRVRIVGPGKRKTDQPRIRVEVAVEDAGGGVAEVRLYHQGRLVGTWPERAAATRGASPPRAKGGLGFDVLLEPGDNRIVAAAYNKARIERRSTPLVVTRTGASVDVGLRALLVGIDGYRDSALRLRYAGSDASAIAEAFTARGKALYRRGVETKVLLDAQATRRGILKGLAWLADATQPEDVALVFLAAHGETVDGTYYLIPQDATLANTEAVAEQGISQAAIMQAIKGIPARKVVVLIDTCKSGALTEAMGTRGLAEKRALSVLGRASGVYLIAASTSQQEAVEDAKLGHGVFTWALLRGLDGAADLDRDRAVSVRELVTFVETEVSRVTRERFQREQFPVTYGTGRNFPVGMVPAR